jgi:branched-chain amino acid transport system permease protein
VSWLVAAANTPGDCISGIFHQFWPQTVNGITQGAIIAMVALGYTMVYGVLQLINFAHSEVFMIGTVITLYAFRNWFGVVDPIGGFGQIAVIVGSMIPAMFFCALTAVVLERVAYRPLRRRGAPRLSFLITAIGASLALQYLFKLAEGLHYIGPIKIPAILGPSPQPLPTLMATKTAFYVFSARVTNTELWVIFVSVVSMIALDQFVRRSRLGRGIRAVAQDKETASLMGVNIDRVIVNTFLIGGIMAGVASMLYVGIFPAVPSFWLIGFTPGITAFTAAVLGGIGNIRGAMLGGLVLGLIQSYSVPCFGARWSTVVVFVVLVLVLMIRPTGILGERIGATA